MISGLLVVYIYIVDKFKDSLAIFTKQDLAAL